MASENERGTSSDSADANGEDEGSDSEPESLPTESLPQDFRATLLQALEGEIALTDEPILSESEISREFSEEDDDEDYVLQILGEEAPELPNTAREPSPPPFPALTPNIPMGPKQKENAELRSIEDDAEAIAKSIAQRTRAHLPLDNITIEELEAQLNDASADEPLLFFGVDDAAEYEKFLASLDFGPFSTVESNPQNMQAEGNLTEHGGVGTGRLPTIDNEEDSDDDEDFLMELERMCFADDGVDGVDDPFDLSSLFPGRNQTTKRKRTARSHSVVSRRQELGGERISGPTNTAPRADMIPPKRRSQRLLARSAEARPLFAAKTYDRQQAAHAVSLLAAGPEHFALAAAYAMSGVPPPYLSSMAPGTGPMGHHPGFVQLPSQQPAALAALATTVTWNPPPHKYFRTEAAKESLGQPTQSLTAATTDDGILGFHPAQYGILHTLIHQHVQLTCQTIVLAMAEGEYITANAAGLLLQEFLQFSVDQGQQRQRSGCSPYNPASLVLVDPIAKHIWAPGPWTLSLGASRYTIADVPILQGVSNMLEELEQAVQETVELSNEPLPGNEQQCLMRLDGSGKLKQLTSNRKQLRKPKKNMEIAWKTLSPEVAHALQHVAWAFDTALEPKVVRFRNTAQTMFTPAEDALLAWGMRKYGYDWERIAQEFLPNKTMEPSALFHRKKNRSASTAPENVIKAAVSFLNAPITPAEQVVIEKALDYYGKQPFKWDTICRQHLPYRHPHVLSMLWGKHLGTLPQQQEVQPHELLNPALLVNDGDGGFPEAPFWGGVMVGDNNPANPQPPHPPPELDHDVWTPEEEKMVLTTALQCGGTLSPIKLRRLAAEMQRAEDCIVRKCEVLVERFREKVREKRAGHPGP